MGLVFPYKFSNCAVDAPKRPRWRCRQMPNVACTKCKGPFAPRPGPIMGPSWAPGAGGLGRKNLQKWCTQHDTKSSSSRRIHVSWTFSEIASIWLPSVAKRGKVRPFRWKLFENWWTTNGWSWSALKHSLFSGVVWSQSRKIWCISRLSPFLQMEMVCLV